MKNQGLLLLLVVVAGVAVYYGLSQKREAQVETVLPPTSEVTISPATSPSVSGAAVIKQIDLMITSPANGTTVRQARIDVRGKTAARAEVFVNEAETVADGNGNFSVTITLDDGENYVLVVATDEQGQVAEKELTVTYDTGQ